MDFEEYVNANYKRLEGQTREFVEDAFEAGQQGKQEEVNKLQKQIDALQKRIDEAMELLEYNEYTDSALQARDVLKGE